MSGLALCTCTHEQRLHLSEISTTGRATFTVCLCKASGARALGYPARQRQCPCVRFAEDSFERQQIALPLEVGR